jgi:hypothetical protein
MIDVHDRLPTLDWFYEQDNTLVVVRLARVDESGMPLDNEQPIYITAKLERGWMDDGVYFTYSHGVGIEYEGIFEMVDPDMYPVIRNGEYKYGHHESNFYTITHWMPIEEFEKMAMSK